MLRILSVILGSGVLIACGVVHGVWTERFQPSGEAQAAVERMQQLPMNFGADSQGRPEWTGEEVPVKPGQAGEGVAGCVQRRYTNARTGKIVTIALICGRPGPVSIHSPDACYAASGFSVEEPRAFEAPGGTFWRADAVRTHIADEVRLRIYWAWNNGGGWKANTDPRQQYVTSRVLYKLYVLRDLEEGGEAAKSDPCQELLKDLLPALDQALFPKDA
jgi:hypothetical protein